MWNNRLFKLLIFTSCSVLFFNAQAQFNFDGKILDDLTKRPVPFARLVAFSEGSISSGTSTNVEGQFRLSTSKQPDSILVSCVG